MLPTLLWSMFDVPVGNDITNPMFLLFIIH